MPNLDSVTSASAGVDLHHIEEQLMSNGYFDPIDYLLDNGWLDFDDYDEWRRNALPVLDSRVRLSPDALLRLLNEAEILARRLRLAPQVRHFYSWRADRSRALLASRDADLARQLSQTWVREESLPQMDMFMDSAATAVENQLAAFLAARQWGEAANAYDKLVGLSPDHCRLGQYRRLLDYGRSLGVREPVGDMESLGREIAGLESRIEPLARELLREHARDFLALAWQRLAHGLKNRPFDPAHPNRHASYPWSRMGHWRNVVDAVTAEAEYAQHFVLLRRLAEAHYHLRARATEKNQPGPVAELPRRPVKKGRGCPWMSLDVLDTRR